MQVGQAPGPCLARIWLATAICCAWLACDGAVHEDRYQIVHVGIGRYCGAGVCLTPTARHDDRLNCRPP